MRGWIAMIPSWRSPMGASADVARAMAAPILFAASGLARRRCPCNVGAWAANSAV